MTTPKLPVGNPFDDYLQVDDMLGLTPRMLDVFQSEVFEMLDALDRIHPPPVHLISQRILERAALEAFLQRISVARSYVAPTRKS